ncbi:MAG TPA: Holliday junction resolvase RuvX [Thermomicrobiales bacterium]|nr:Holliday junction resolvase RuvX [Thermomicrobiales bacterium]
MSRGAGRAMSLDVGERRIGVAIGDELDMISSPLSVVQRRAGDLAEIRDLAREKGVDRIVVGLPTGLSGREGPQAALVRQFAEALAAEVSPSTTVEFWDERLTTMVAERALRESRNKRQRRKGDVDAVAAAVILQGYLDAGRARTMRMREQDNVDAR